MYGNVDSTSSQVMERPKTWLLSTCGAFFAILPVLKVSAYVFDFGKDVALTTGVNKVSHHSSSNF